MIYSDRFNYAPFIINNSNNKKSKGYIKNISKKFIFGDEGVMIIPQQFAYRPDLISKYLYKSDQWGWLLATINKINNSPKGFEAGKEIIFTNPDRLK